MQYSLIILSATILFLCIFALGIYLFRGRILIANRILFTLAVFVLLVKVAQYIYYFSTGNAAKYPVEFCDLACVVFSLVVFFDKKKVAFPFAAYAAFISGVAMNFLLFIGQDTFVNMRESNVWLLLNIFVNDALLLGSLLMMGNFLFTHKTVWQIPLGVGVFLGWAFLAKYALHYVGNIYTVRIFDATLFDNVWAEENPAALASPHFDAVYYVILAFAILLSLVLVLGLNRLIYKHDRLNEYYLDEEEY